MDNKYEKQIEAVHALRDVVSGLKDSQLGKAIKTAFDKKKTGFILSYVKEGYTGKQIHIWGNGLEYDKHRIYFSWNPVDIMGQVKDQPERELLAHELDRADCSDYLERQQEEDKYFEQLSKYEEEIERIRESARLLAAVLHRPKSATLRADACFWDKWSYETEKKFPALFKREG